MNTRSLCAAVLTLASAALAQPRSPVSDVSKDAFPATHEERWAQPRPVANPAVYSARLAANYIDVNSPPEGDLPRELAFTPDGQTVVIANQGSTALLPGTLTFYNVNTRTITNTVTVGKLANYVAVSPDGQLAVCTNVFSNTLSVVQISNHTLLANIPITGNQPFRVAITPDSHTAVVAVTNDGVNSAFSIVDLTSLTEVRTFPSSGQGAIGGFATPEEGISGALWSQFALTPDGTTIVLPDSVGARVMLYDVATGAATPLATAANGMSVDISRDGTTAIVGHEFGTRKISRVDLAARTLTQITIPDDINSEIIRITPDKAYAIGAISNNTVFYNLATGAAAATLFTGAVGDIEISYNNQYAFVSNFNSSVIDIASRTIVRSLTLAACSEAACSPTQLRAVALNDRFREDIQLYNINGASGFAEGLTLTGEPPEGDCTRTLALSGDGRTLIAGNTTSRNAAIIDVPTRSVLAYIDTGDRVLDTAMTPDGHYALVCNTEDSTVSVIDVPARTRVAQLSCPTRPAKVKISPDGTKAYVLAVAGTDMIYFININGAASSVVGTIIAGQTGTAGGYTYTENSGIELSPDGSILAVCVSFDDNVKLINTATRTLIADVPVGIDASTMEFPIRCAFTPAGNRLYVSMSFGNAVAVVNINGAASSRISTIGGINFPLTLNVDPTGQFVYVGNQGSSPALRVIDTATNTIVGTVQLGGGNIRAAALDNGILYAAGDTSTGAGQMCRIAAQGASSSLIDITPLSSSPSDLVFSHALQAALIAQPVPDGVDEVLVGPACGSADFNCDGDIGTDQDIDSFFSCLSGVCPPAPCAGSADFNGDGDVGTDQDIEAFFRVLAGGSC